MHYVNLSRSGASWHVDGVCVPMQVSSGMELVRGMVLVEEISAVRQGSGGEL